MTKKNSKHVFVLIVSMLVACLVNAQNISTQSVNSSAGKLMQSNGSLCFTIGELSVSTLIDTTGNTLSGGFINSAVITTTIVSIDESNQKVLDVKVYPNPTSDLVFIDITATQLEWILVEICDMQGKMILNDKYAGISNKIGINTTSFNKGTYILTLKEKNGNLLSVYKLLKQ